MGRQGLVPVAAALLGASAAAAAVAFVAGPFSAQRARLPQSELAALGHGGAEGAAPQDFPAPPGAAPEAEAEDAFASAWRWLGAGLVAGLVLSTSLAPAEAVGGPPGTKTDDPRVRPVKSIYAKDWPWLAPCKDVKKFHKRFKDNVYKLTQRQKKYPKDTVPYKRYEAIIAQTKRREEGYGTRLCDKNDGRPRVIATGEWNVRGSVTYPALMFLYTAGWIGWAGRSYLVRTRSEKLELNLDVPLALTCMASGFAWPVAAWQDIVNGKMVVPDTELHVSGRANGY